MRTAALAALVLFGCSNDKQPSPKPKPEPRVERRPDATPDAMPRPKSVVAPPAADLAVTQLATTTVLVVVKADGEATLVPQAEPGDVDLVALTMNAPIPLGELGDQIAALHRDVIAKRTQGGVVPTLRDGGVGDPCAIWGDGEMGGLLGNEPGEMSGGFGYGRAGFGPGGNTGYGTIGTGRYGTIGHGRGPIPAGLIGTRAAIGSCHDTTPLVVADERLPATKLVELLASLPSASLAVTTDGGATARPLLITFLQIPGSLPPEPDTVELGFTVRPDGVRGAAYRGVNPDDATWTWSGDLAGLGGAYHQGQAVGALLGAQAVRIRIDGDLTTGALLTAIAALLAANVNAISIGEPVYAASGYGTNSSSRGRPAVVPRLTLGQPTIDGGYDKATLRRYLRRNQPKFKFCYERVLLAKPAIEGTVTATFTITPTGSITQAAATGVDPEVESCIAGFLVGIEVPKPKDGKPVTVSYPFTFAPTGG